jgi:ribulose-phosphate 3-epimerase
MSEVIPAILAKSVSDLELKLSEIPEEIDFVHIDVLDEDFWTETSLNFEAHLMVNEPGAIIEKWIERGAKRIIVHDLEALGNLVSKSFERGLGVELHIPLEEIFSIIPKVDFIHLMSIAEIGEQGHLLDEKIFDRIKKVKAKFPQVPISIDGGINTTNHQALRDAGADRLIVGSGFKDLWKSLTKN